MSRRGVKPVAGNKEDTLFREALKLYESKHYKKSVKNCDLILKKSTNSNYVESLSLKALNLYFLKELNESEAYVKKTLDKNENNPVANHIIGILRRAQLNYKQAAVFFKKALDNGSANKQIWRDLSVMELQNRDYKSVTKSRHAYLEDFLGYRANWTSLAIAHHLNSDFGASEKTLSKFEDLVKGKLNEAEMYENSELALYKNQIIYESGDVERALKDLDQLDSFDKLVELEWRGKYYLNLKDFEKASKVYRTLLKRNPDNIKYYNFLEISLNTLGKSEKFRDELYQKLVKFYPRSDPPKFIPLFFTTGDLFVKRITNYLIPSLERGVPSIFTNLKPLYKSQPEKIPIIEKILLDYYANIPKDKPLVWVWTTYYLAQHYLFLKNLAKASELVDAAIAHTPTLVELYILKARVLKHLNEPVKAAEVINKGRLIDLQDRFINTKTVKYYLRANDITNSLNIVSIFTKNEGIFKNGLKDLHMMQVNWFLIENAETYLRLYKLAKREGNQEDVVKYGGLALKRFKAIVKVYDEYYNDQLDFHTYCMRRGTARAYVEMLHWEDKVYTSSVYLRAMAGVSKILLDDEKVVLEEKEVNKKDKIANLKKVELEKSELLAYEPEEDDDVFGFKLYNAENWLDLFNDEYFKNLLNQGPELIITNNLNFKLNFKLKKVLILFQSLNKLKLLTGAKYELLSYYLILVRFKLNEVDDGNKLNKILTEKLLVKYFEDFKFDDLDGEIKKQLPDLKSFKQLLCLVKIVNLELSQIDNKKYKKVVLENAEFLEPFEKKIILEELK